MAKTHNVNLTKALAEIRQWPGARTDRKVFQAIADNANDKGVCTLSETEIADIVGMTRGAVFTSVNRLAIHGLTTLERKETPDYYQLECTIARRYMRSADLAASVQHVANACIRVLLAAAEAYAKKYDDLAEQLDDIAANIRKATGNN